MNAKKILKTLDYLPRWSWYLLAFFFAGGPLGCLGVYLVFHVLKKMKAEQEESEYVHQRQGAERADRVYRDEDCTVTSEEENRRQQPKAESASRSAASQIISEDAEIDEVICGGQDAMRRIREANDIIADPALSAQIDSIENSCAQILSLLEQRPQLLSQLRTFLRYYLPTTLRLLEARAKLENTARTPKAREVRARISEAVGAIDKAFQKQVEALDAYRFIDLESEMDVLRDMLKADGLLGDEQDADPFAAVMGKR